MSEEIIQGEIVPYGEPLGRPCEYRDSIAKDICRLIAEGEPLTRICKRPDMPSLQTVYNWLARPDRADFVELYKTARSNQADTMFDQITEIADDGTNDWMEQQDKDGDLIGWRVNGEHIQRSSLRIKARQWQAARLRPRKYGDATILKHADAEGDKLETAETSILELARLTVFLLSKAGQIADKPGVVIEQES
jgi:hypothetical protein